MPKSLATLLGIGITASLVMISASGAAAVDERTNCYRYPIGTICVVRGWDNNLNASYFYGTYTNTGASSHTGHIDLYIWSGVALQGNPHTVRPKYSYSTTHISVIGNTEVHADFVDKNGTHFHSPTERALSGP